MGPSGSGKTAIMRALFGFWPISSGEIITPSFESLIGKKRIMMLPQTSLLVPGSLKSQIIYPDNLDELSLDELCSINANIEALLETLELSHLIARAGGIDCEQNLSYWLNNLSPGEQQRLVFGRILFWRPDYASNTQLYFSFG